MPFPLAIPAIIGGAKVLGSILGRGAKGQADAQRYREQTNLSRDQLAQRAYQLNADVPGQRLSTGMAANRAANWTPVKFNRFGPEGRPTLTGGYNDPNLYSPESRALGQSVLRDMLQQQQSGVRAPGPTPPPREGRGSKILGGLALGSSILGGLGSVIGDVGNAAGLGTEFNPLMGGNPGNPDIDPFDY